ncbi:hypothetical protein BD410DRAFT_719135 [Rickenella mellea]|uniref:Tyr recombinase domain-containing protein n=1 Tax=Rickenella mellea TaxID=50990 RepID=A0A4Y7QCC1_9AGAM|nr:hypothetical protein BD410DRAFT_719135 [Rickenella mellea]
MTRSWFMDRCNEIWNAAGYPELTGHSFRIGGATELLSRGVQPDIVATQGRWRSHAFLAYWRNVHRILPNFISSAGTG